MDRQNRVLQGKLETMSRQLHLQNQLISQHHVFRERLSRAAENAKLSDAEKLHHLKKVIKSPINEALLNFEIFERSNSTFQATHSCTNCLKFVPFLVSLLALLKTLIKSRGETPLETQVCEEIESFILVARNERRVDKTVKISDRVSKLARLSHEYASSMVKICGTREFAECLGAKCVPYQTLCEVQRAVEDAYGMFYEAVRNPSSEEHRINFYSAFKNLYKNLRDTLADPAPLKCAKIQYKSLQERVKSISLS